MADENADAGEAETVTTIANGGDGDVPAKESKSGEEAGESKAAEGEASKEGEDGAGKEGDEKGEESAGAPDEYKDFTFPDGVKADEKLMEGFLPLAKELNLTQDQAQKLLDVQIQGAQATATAQAEAWDTQVDTWSKETRADKEIGGENLKESAELSNRVLDKLGTPGLKEVLDQTGLGNKLAVVQFLVAVGKAIGEDKMDGGDPSPSDKQDPANILFPNQN